MAAPRAKKKKQNEFVVNTIIGPHSFIRGEVNSGGFTRVDGYMKGNLHAEGRVVVGENARMQSSITGTAVTVGGVVTGNVLASERLVVLSSAVILGDITTRRIEVHEGSLVHGRIRVCQTEEAWKRAASEYQDKRHG
ncbi:MAG: polymer-forming cytoskeletal protein [Treponema sp.]|jgi:cytoskeletal protein CcmA (bactofilin family)|nr:polymer-forming cytoskeletal protein [Treponema sp.]